MKLSSTPVIETKNVTKIYKMEDVEVRALDGVCMKIMPGEMVAITGKSGSGKSTLMHIIGLLDSPTKGQVLIDGIDVSKLKSEKLAEIRSGKIGFVFQQFNLLSRTSALDNVMLPLIYAGVPASERKERAQELLKKVDLEHRMENKPNQLSGGQQQRVAIARALINRPSLILADEPTGNLDTRSGNQIEDLLKQIHKEGNTVVVVTHDETLAKKCGRVIRLVDGKISC